MTFTADSPEGWTASLNETTAGASTLTNGWLMPQKGDSAAIPGQGFLTTAPITGETVTGQEKYYYTIELAQILEDAVVDEDGGQIGPLMGPIVDDVTIFYMPSRAARVLVEREVVHD